MSVFYFAQFFMDVQELTLLDRAMLAHFWPLSSFYVETVSILTALTTYYGIGNEYCSGVLVWTQSLGPHCFLHTGDSTVQQCIGIESSHKHHPILKEKGEH